MSGLRKLLLFSLISMTLFNITASSSFLIKTAVAATPGSVPNQTAIADIVKCSNTVFNANGLYVNHVELARKDTFPVFYLSHDDSVNLENEDLLAEIAAKNGYGDFKAVDDRDAIEVYCNRRMGRIERTVSEKGVVEFLLDNSQSQLSVAEARTIAASSCQKPGVGVSAAYAANCDVVIANTRYYCFDLAYQLPKIEKEIITYRKFKKKRVPVRKTVFRTTRLKTIPAVMINSVDGAAYEAVRERSSDGRTEYYLTRKVETVPPLTVSSQ
jgi:hypothetical protein